jgi:hypothetical protein
MMTCQGTIQGGAIQLNRPLPFADGQAVNVSIEPVEQDDPPPGSPAAILAALKSTPPIDPSIVDEFERIIEESKRPIQPGGIFDEDDGR